MDGAAHAFFGKMTSRPRAEWHFTYQLLCELLYAMELNLPKMFRVVLHFPCMLASSCRVSKKLSRVLNKDL
jgi:hypothetical protein